MDMNADARLRRAVIVCAVHGFTFTGLGILSLAGTILASILGKIPESAGSSALIGAVVGGLAVACLGLPGIAAFIFRRKGNAHKFTVAAGAILALHVFVVPFSLPGPVFLPILIFGVAAAGVWILLTLYSVALERESNSGEPG